MDSNMDLDPSHYTLEEMKELLELKVVNEKTIRFAVEREMSKHTDEKILSFYWGIQMALLGTLQGVNPNVKNEFTRIIHIDSSHLPSYADTTTTDKFTFDLSDQINNVISLSLESIELPQSWYTFSFAKGTTSFAYFLGDTKYEYTLDDGNYTVTSLLTAIKTFIQEEDASFGYSLHRPSGKVTFYSDENFKFMWHDTAMIVYSLRNTYANYHLGTLLGFNSVVSESTYVFERIRYEIKTATPIHVAGTRYVTLEVNDYSSNRISNNIVLINSLPRIRVPPPDYYQSDTPQVRTGPNTTQVLNNETLTAQQTTSLNSIIDPPPVGRILIARQASNLFAKIPLKRNNYITTTDGVDDISEKGYAPHIAELAGSLQLNTREFFGPITLRSLEVSLYDDRGLPLGLNGIHWSCSILVRCVYQKKDVS